MCGSLLGEYKQIRMECSVPYHCHICSVAYPNVSSSNQEGVGTTWGIEKIKVLS